MSVAVVMNRLRKGFYLDSVALMRISKEISSLPGVKLASMMIGTPANKQVLAEAGLLNDEGRTAEANDVIVSLRADTGEVGEAALAEAEKLLAAPALEGGGGFGWRPKTLDAALDVLPAANLALISVPGEFAGEEARRALRKNLHVMLFSDHVSLEEERLLKAEARERGLLLMGPDCGTAILGGVPLAFANEVPRGGVGLIAASGTGLQEVACLIGRGGGGISHAIGVGGRDLNDEVGGDHDALRDRRAGCGSGHPARRFDLKASGPEGRGSCIGARFEKSQSLHRLLSRPGGGGPPQKRPARPHAHRGRRRRSGRPGRFPARRGGRCGRLGFRPGRGGGAGYAGSSRAGHCAPRPRSFFWPAGRMSGPTPRSRAPYRRAAVQTGRGTFSSIWGRTSTRGADPIP